MLKQLIHSGKFRLGHAVDPGPLTIVMPVLTQCLPGAIFGQ
jgi:hypothetical protein